jgi:class 3 adenylate cyclase
MAVVASDIRYARNRQVSLAYQVVGDGPFDIVVVPGFVSHVELNWETFYGWILERLARSARVIMFDKRGTGLSDRSVGVATLEDRVDDVRAVMDAAGVERACLLGLSEGAPMSLMMAASHPDRVSSLALYGAFARLLWAPDYSIGYESEEAARVVDVERQWGSGQVLAGFVAHSDGSHLPLLARFERNCCTPGIAAEIQRLNLEIDVRPLLGAINVPTLVVHVGHDPVIPRRFGRYMADQIPGGRYVEIDGDFHASWVRAEIDAVLDPIEEFFTGVPTDAAVAADRVLATVLFTDIVDSTRHAAEMGDHEWRQVLDEHETGFKTDLQHFRGQLVNTTGDGFVATFDGPARAIGCALAAQARARHQGMSIRAGIHTGECERRGSDIAGMAVHIGARVAGLAAPDEVLVSSTVRDLVVGSGIEFEDRGRRTLKGVPGRWHLLAVRND